MSNETPKKAWRVSFKIDRPPIQFLDFIGVSQNCLELHQLVNIGDAAKAAQRTEGVWFLWGNELHDAPPLATVVQGGGNYHINFAEMQPYFTALWQQKRNITGLHAHQINGSGLIDLIFDKPQKYFN